MFLGSLPSARDWLLLLDCTDCLPSSHCAFVMGLMVSPKYLIDLRQPVHSGYGEDFRIQHASSGQHPQPKETCSEVVRRQPVFSEDEIRRSLRMMKSKATQVKFYVIEF